MTLPFAHLQRNAFVLPVIQILGRVDRDPHIGSIATRSFGLELSKPEVCPIAEEESSTMRVDGHAAGVRPQFPWPERRRRLHWLDGGRLRTRMDRDNNNGQHCGS
jgi:hypothetical protein